MLWWLAFLVESGAMYGLTLVSMVGLWLLVQHSSVGWLVLFVNSLGLLIMRFRFEHGTPLTHMAGLWALVLSPGLLSFAVLGLPSTLRALAAPLRWCKPLLLWCRERQQRAKQLKDVAKHLGAWYDQEKHAVHWSPTEDSHSELCFVLQDAQPWTCWRYTGYGRIPFTLQLNPSYPQDEAGLLQALPVHSWLNFFEVMTHWRPFMGLYDNSIRFFGELPTGHFVKGEELQTLVHLGPRQREQLAALPVETEYSIHEGNVFARHPGILTDGLKGWLEQLQALSHSLGRSVEAPTPIPAVLLTNLQAETEPLLQIRLLEFLLGRYPEAPEAKAACAWAETQTQPVVQLLSALYQNADGLPKLLAILRNHELALPLRRAAWERLWYALDATRAVPLLEDLLQHKTDDDDEEDEKQGYHPLCLGLIQVVADDPHPLASAPILQWLRAVSEHFDEELARTMLAWYNACPDEDVEELEEYAFSYLSAGLPFFAEDLLMVAERRGNHKTLARLNMLLRQIEREKKLQRTFVIDPRQEALRKSIQFLQLRLGKQEQGQLSLAPPEAHEGNLSLTPEAEGGGLSVLPEEGLVSLAGEKP